MADSEIDELASALGRLISATVDAASRDGTNLEQLCLPNLDEGRPKSLDNSRYLDWAREIYQIRQMRSKHFPEIFGEPAWDLLLDLYIAYLEGRKVITKSACIGARCSTATAVRKIHDLEAIGLVHRVDDVRDRRLKWICLSKEAIWAMNHLCEEAMGSKRQLRR